MTWYVARGSCAVAIDASEAYGVSVVVGLGELCAAISTTGELVAAASPVGVSVVVSLGELCAAISTTGELLVVAGVGDVATDRLFG